ncbi:MAG: hypothetical protein MUC40_02280 [Akkermansiaceae bacterium]|jgi:hypothetical protein|nr:hypothetical protein [Akkermansiaceae bacterium]
MNLIKKDIILALALASGLAAPPTTHAATITNGSFETGFSSWVTTDLTSPHVSLAVRTNGYNSGFGFASTIATNGAYAVSHGFDGNGPGTIIIAQDVGTIDISSATLTFDHRAGWNMLDYGGSTQDRVFSVVIRPSGGGTAIASFEILRAPFGTRNYDTGPLAATVDLSPYIGTNARISFEAYIPQNFTGPAFMQLDNVQLSNAIPEPSSTLLTLLFSTGLLCRRRRHA